MITFYFLLYLLWIVPGFQRVTLIPMKTTLFSRGICHTEKQPFLEKGLTLEIKLGPLFQGLVCPKYSELEAKDPQFYTIPQMNGPQIFVLQKNLRTYTSW